MSEVNMATLVKLVQSDQYPFPLCMYGLIGQRVEVVSIAELEAGVAWVLSPCENAHPILAECLQLGDQFTFQFVERRRRENTEKYMEARFLGKDVEHVAKTITGRYRLGKRRKETIDLIAGIINNEVQAALDNRFLGDVTMNEAVNLASLGHTNSMVDAINYAYRNIEDSARCIAMSARTQPAAEELSRALLMADVMEAEAVNIRRAVNEATKAALQASAKGVLDVRFYGGVPILPIPWPALKTRLTAKDFYVSPTSGVWREAGYYFPERFTVTEERVASYGLARDLTPEEKRIYNEGVAPPRPLLCVQQKVQAMLPPEETCTQAEQ